MNTHETSANCLPNWGLFVCRGFHLMSRYDRGVLSEMSQNLAPPRSQNLAPPNHNYPPGKHLNWILPMPGNHGLLWSEILARGSQFWHRGGANISMGEPNLAHSEIKHPDHIYSHGCMRARWSFKHELMEKIFAAGQNSSFKRGVCLSRVFLRWGSASCQNGYVDIPVNH